MRTASIPSLRRRPATAAGAVLVVAALLQPGPSARAQSVNRCQVEGRVVFQAHACPSPALRSSPADAAPAPVRVAAGSPAESPKKKGLADLLRDRDGPGRTRPVPRDEPVADGANVLPAAMGAF